MIYRPEVDDKLCFVLMPFRDPFNGYYEHIIKAVVRAAGLEPLRADEVFGARSIIRDIWEHIWRARLVIADVTDRNPNVNYELGLCHALGVPTILITQRIEDVPFDYRHRRCIDYHTEQATWIDKLSGALNKTICAVLSDRHNNEDLEWPYDTFTFKQFAVGGAISVENSRQILLRGMAQLKVPLSRAFGPRGVNVSVTLPTKEVVSHKQGSAIAEGFHSVNPIEENGLDQMRKAGRFMGEAVGDGTKTAMLLAHALVEGAQSALNQGHPLKDVLNGMEKSVAAARSWMSDHSQRCTVERLSAVAVTASSDSELSGLVVQGMREVGKDGIIIIDAALGSGSELQIKEGLRFERGYLSAEFVTNGGSQNCELMNCRVLVYEMKISTMRGLLPLLELVARDGRPLLVIADDVEGEALATLVINHVRGTIRCAAVRAPGAGDRRNGLLRDIAVFTGAKLVGAELGLRLEQIRLEDLGTADRVSVTRESTTILGGRGSERALREHADALRAAIDCTHDQYERENLQERLATLAGRVATIVVRGRTEVDLEDRRYRAASALHSTSAAVEEGVSYGGGIALVSAKEAIAAVGLETEGERAGASAVVQALDVPFVVLAKSIQKSSVSLLKEIQDRAQPGVGLNTETGTLEDMSSAGILDPTKTLRVAIDTAFSYAKGVLRTDVWSLTPSHAGEPRAAS